MLRNTKNNLGIVDIWKKIRCYERFKNEKHSKCYRYGKFSEILKNMTKYFQVLQNTEEYENMLQTIFKHRNIDILFNFPEYHENIFNIEKTLENTKNHHKIFQTSGENFQNPESTFHI